MTDANKPLGIKHAHITGQAMRDHWGPIVDRIAAETADWRDAWIYDLTTENEKLRAVVDALLQYEASDFWGPDGEKNKRASYRGVIRKAKKVYAELEGTK